MVSVFVPFVLVFLIGILKKTIFAVLFRTAEKHHLDRMQTARRSLPTPALLYKLASFASGCHKMKLNTGSHVTVADEANCKLLTFKRI